MRRSDDHYHGNDTQLHSVARSFVIPRHPVPSVSRSDALPPLHELVLARSSRSTYPRFGSSAIYAALAFEGRERCCLAVAQGGVELEWTDLLR